MGTFSGGPKTGHKMKLYRNTGTQASPVWSLVAEVGDVSIADLSIALAELKRRANNFTKNLPGLFNSIGVEFRLHHGLDEANFSAIRSKFFAQEAEEWAIMNSAIAGSDSRGLRCPFLVEQFPWDQALEDVSGHDVRLAVAYMESGGSEVDPAWQNGTSSTS